MNLLLLLPSADPLGTGRVDRSLLSDQTLMELLFAELSNLNCVQTSDGDFLPIDSWPCVKLDEEGNVVEIDVLRTPWKEETRIGKACRREKRRWQTKHGGPVDLQWLPPNLRAVKLCNCNMEGSVETSILPRDLLSFDIRRNSFSGTFSVEELPTGIEKVDIRSNKFNGTLDLATLPKTIEAFHAGSNAFTGTPDVGNLPKSLQSLELAGNAFTGEFAILSELNSDLQNELPFDKGFVFTRLGRGPLTLPLKKKKANDKGEA